MALSTVPAADCRATLFRESLGDMAERWMLGLAWALAPRRIGPLPNLARLGFHELLAPAPRSRVRARIAMAAGIIRAASYQPLLITFPISGTFAIHLRMRE